MKPIISRRDRSRGQGGFTLIEVLVATVILATAIVGALGAFSASSKTLGLSQFNATVTQLAQGKMAEVRTLDELPLGESDGDFGEDYPGFTWRLDIEPVPEQAITDQESLQGLYQVDLTVIGRALGKERQVTFVTYTL